HLLLTIFRAPSLTLFPYTTLFRSCEGDDMEKEEYALYKELLANMLEHVEPPKLMIYLETTVDSVIKKIKKRGRDYEQIVEREYRSEEHTSELQSRENLVCRLLLEK